MSRGTKLAPRREEKTHDGSDESLAPKAAAKRKPSVPPALPSVNLLSPWAFERLAVRRLRIRFVAGGVALVLLAAALWGFQAMRVADAESLLTIEHAETARLAEKTKELQPVKTYLAGVEQQKATVSGAMGTEIYFSKVLAAMRDAAPPGVVLDSIVVTLAPAPTTPVAAAPSPDSGQESGEEDGAPAPAPTAPATPSLCPGPDPFQTRRVVACIELSGSAGSRAEVGAFVVALGADDSFVEPFISTTTTADAARVTFSGSVGLSEKVFSGRYAELETWLTGKE